MPKVALYNRQGETVGEIELNDNIFATEVNESLIHDVVVMYQANQRVGTSSTKTRAMVRGGGRKPWRQKGTGRARVGTIRSPLWRGGGIIFGPQPRDFSYTMPKKARRQALRSALSAKVNGNQLIVLDELSMDKPKTKELVEVLKNLGVAEDKTLVVLPEGNYNVVLSANNLPKVDAADAASLNVYEVVNHAKLVLTKDALAKIEEVLA